MLHNQNSYSLSSPSLWESRAYIFVNGMDFARIGLRNAKNRPGKVGLHVYVGVVGMYLLPVWQDDPSGVVICPEILVICSRDQLRDKATVKLHVLIVNSRFSERQHYDFYQSSYYLY